MDVIVKKLGNFAKVSAPKGYYALNNYDNNIIKTTMVVWTDESLIKSQWSVITPEEKAEIEALLESEGGEA